MRIKTILIIGITILVTIVLMKNTDEVDFWIFGTRYISKLTILAVMFALGFIVGFVAGRPRRKDVEHHEQEIQKNYDPDDRDKLSDEDREYIS
ncbi:MAG TPA: LapA family protein [Sphingobacteriaceae bacterium]